MAEHGLTARVAVQAAVYSIDRPYDYRVPQEYASLVPGQRVMVPFGLGDRAVCGIVLSLEEGNVEGLKPILYAFSRELVLTGSQRELALWMCRRYFCTFFQAASAMLPPGSWSRQPETFRPAEPLPDPRDLTPRQKALLEAALLAGTPQTAAQLTQSAGLDNGAEPLKRLSAGGFLIRELHYTSKPLERDIVLLSCPHGADQAREMLGKRNRAARETVLNCVLEAGVLPEKEVCYRTGASTALVRRLVKQGILEARTLPESQAPAPSPPVTPPELVLSPQQEEAAAGLMTLMAAGKPEAALLWGVTGSGKTQVYIRLIQAALERGKSAILLVPEIALTPQMQERIRAFFGDTAAVIHSGLTPARRSREYSQIQSGRARVVIGTRTAVFAPVKELGLLILDEEQEPSYKSDSDPRYHAREVAKYRAAREKCLLLLGSATPSVESFYAAEEGVYHRFTLPSRYGDTPLPRTILADMRGQLREGDPSLFSPLLLDELESNLRRGEQSILFLNRRGSARMLACTGCGYIPMCENCSTALVYHSRNRRLMCHHCGYSIPAPAVCPACGGKHLRLLGSGTQSAEDALLARFPGIRTLRMDADTTQGRATHEALLERFAAGEADVLLGTQMVAKGLDFPRVTLVGVLEADLSLYCGDYRAAERTFSLLAQVVGRAGRRETPGRAVIQTFTPENPVILAAADQDYLRFYRREIETRRALQAPPFCDVFVFRFSGENEGRVWQAARGFAALAREELPRHPDLLPQLLGPAPAAIARVNRKYYVNVSFRGQNRPESRALTGRLLAAAERLPACRGVTVTADINPNDL